MTVDEPQVCDQYTHTYVRTASRVTHASQHSSPKAQWRKKASIGSYGLRVITVKLQQMGQMPNALFSSIHDRLTEVFPSENITAQMANTALQEAFPNIERKRIGSQRHTYIYGIELSTPSVDIESVDELRVLNQQLKMQIQQLESRVHELEECTPAHSSSSPLLSQQFDMLLRHGDQIFNGPDTPTHFTEFSLKMVTEEIKLNAPDVFRLFVQLGNAQRHAGEDETPAEQRKAVVSLCTLLNARSQKANGLQLLVSFMLVARATSKQVLTTIYRELS